MFNVLNHATIKDCITQFPDAEFQLKVWYNTCKKSDWDSLNDLKIDFPNASIVKDDRIVFNIKGNHYRLVTRISFRHKRIMVKWFGTHSEYDKIDVNLI